MSWAAPHRLPPWATRKGSPWGQFSGTGSRPPQVFSTWGLSLGKMGQNRPDLTAPGQAQRLRRADLQGSCSGFTMSWAAARRLPPWATPKGSPWGQLSGTGSRALQVFST